MKTVAPNLTPDQFKVFITLADKKRLNPLAKQIFAVNYDGNMVIQTSIDGYLLIASRTGRYLGTCNARLRVKGKDGKGITIKHEEYDPDEYPNIISGTIGVRVKGREEPEEATALFKSYAKTFKDKTTGEMKLGKFWLQLGDVMILKCALGKALRVAFPEDLSDLYVQEEMDQATPDPPVTIRIIETPKKKLAPPIESVDNAKLVEEKFAAVFAYLEEIGASSECMTRAKALILENFDTDNISTIDINEFTVYCRKGLLKALKAENLLPGSEAKP